jgi:hypothetical protein
MIFISITWHIDVAYEVTRVAGGGKDTPEKKFNNSKNLGRKMLYNKSIKVKIKLQK